MVDDMTQSDDEVSIMSRAIGCETDHARARVGVLIRESYRRRQPIWLAIRGGGFVSGIIQRIEADGVKTMWGHLTEWPWIVDAQLPDPVPQPLPLIGRDRVLAEELTKELRARTFHPTTRPWELSRGNAYDVQFEGPDVGPSVHIFTVSVTLKSVTDRRDLPPG